jgi:DNA (cytosine-5)-methyltransferase 1
VQHTAPNRWVIGNLFSGIGGMSLAARWMGWDTTFHAEVEPYASAVLAKNFPGVPNLGDVKQIDGTTMAPVDILTGGFPCQDISLAGRGAGITGERSGLWKEYARLIGELRPRYVLAENVCALRTRGLDVVLSDLGALGYDAEWHCIPASAVGAPHQRDRIWILAYPSSPRRREDPKSTYGDEGSDEGGTEKEDHLPASDGEGNRGGSVLGAMALGSNTGWQWWATEPAVDRVANGLPKRVDRLRVLGNTIVPQIPFQIFRAIQAVDSRPSLRWVYNQLVA